MTQSVPVAMAQGSSCWGCFQSIIDMHMSLAEVLPLLDIKYWAAVVDFKRSDLENYPDKSIAVGFFEGVCRTDEDIHLLKTMREKCKTLIAFGSCSCFGGIPGMANLFDTEQCMKAKFLENETFDHGQIPTTNVPKFVSVLKPNRDYVDFDVYLPGCPPTPSLILKAVTALIEGKPLELPEHTVCHYCKREKKETPVSEIKRPFVGVADPQRCLLEQGYLCLGSATWGLCEGACVNKGAACRGCFGPPPPITSDHGAKAISMLGTYAPIEPDRLVEQVPDPVGYFYRFTYPSSHLGAMHIRRTQKSKEP